MKIELKPKNVAIIKFSIRNFEIKITKTLIFLDFIYSILEGFLHSSVLIKNRYDSFCKQYSNNDAKFYINGCGDIYFHDMHEELLKAKKEVFINDWFLSPQIYLKRPIEDHPESRLDYVLTHLANKGVHVFVIIYKEVEDALYNNSYYTKQYLNKCHSNIHVVRHPRFFIHFWSHHEKMCIIDGRVVFMGGIDLCYGRYELPNYPLKEPNQLRTYFKGQDYSNPRIKDFEDVHKWDMCLIDKNSEPRMPWRDIAIRLQGDIVKGMKKHFLQFWSFNNIQFAYKNTIIRNMSNIIRPTSRNKFI